MSEKIYYLLTLFCWFIIPGAFAQNQKIADSLTPIYQENKLKDTAKLELLKNLSYNEIKDLDKALKYSEDLISLSEQTGNNSYLRSGYFIKGTKQRLLGNYDEALDAFFRSVEIAKKTHHLTAEGDTYGAIGDVYSLSNNHATAMTYYHKGIAILRQANDPDRLASILSNTGDEFRRIASYDSALFYFRESSSIFDKIGNLGRKAYSIGCIGMVYASVGKNDIAEKNINEAVKILEEIQDYYPICDFFISIADVYLQKGDDKTALKYALRSLHLAEQHKLKEQISSASLKLSELYEKSGDFEQSLKYYKHHIAYRDIINNPEIEREISNLQRNYDVSQKQLEVNLLQQQKRTQFVSLCIILGLSILIVVVLLKNNRNKQKAYKILNLQRQETEAQKAKAEDALAELQVTQKQLIQSAKMASLGELTAGIAHEIQNPLNFVNNFSELSAELLDELKQGTLSKLEYSGKPQAEEIMQDITDNLNKITYHGKRADAIVKGMLQHSRASTGKKEPTDINALADQYLNLSYHGLRAADKEFNANFTTDFDKGIGKLEVIPQEIGRVLLNLYNNAFYAVNEKKKNAPPPPEGGIKNPQSEYEPTVTVKTSLTPSLEGKGAKVMIRVKDNGNGIPETVVEKIFQPFFTTKPTGQGTGLGLSLSYDIIKAHGGEFKVETKEGEFAEFIIELPIGKNYGTSV